MDKRNLKGDYLTITEFAKYVGISPSALRHYDKVGAFVAAKHGVELENNYRYYSPLQITYAKMIRVLREIGVPLIKIKKLNKHRTPGKVLKLLHTYENEIAGEIRRLRETASVISTFTELLNKAISITENELSIVELPKRRILLGNEAEYTGEIGFMREFINFCNGEYNQKLNMSYPIGGYWEGMDSFIQDSTRPQRFFSLDPKGKQKWESGLHIVGYTRGYYGTTNDLTERVIEYADKNGLAFNGSVYNLYLTDEISESDPDQYLLEMSVSVKEIRNVKHPDINHRF